MHRESRSPMVTTLLLAAFIGGLQFNANAQSRETATHTAGAGPSLQATAHSSRVGTREVDRLFAWKVQEPDAQPLQRRDALWNGLLIGAGVGALLGLIPDYYDDCEECHDSLYASIAVGAGVGLLIDLLRNAKPSTSPSRKSDVFGMHTAVSPSAFALTGSIAWR